MHIAKAHSGEMGLAGKHITLFPFVFCELLVKKDFEFYIEFFNLFNRIVLV